jgi:hypothetical protein
MGKRYYYQSEGEKLLINLGWRVVILLVTVLCLWKIGPVWL